MPHDWWQMKQRVPTRTIVLVGAALALAVVSVGAALWDYGEASDQTAALRVETVCRLADELAGEDVSSYLEERARQRGEVNVIWGDRSVRLESPTTLDPL